MILRPSATLTLGNLRYDSHVVRFEICLGLLPRGGSVEVRLPASARFEASAGDDAQVDVDGGEGSERVLTGKVREVVRTPYVTIARLHDAGGILAEYRPSVTFEHQSAADVVRGLASDAGVSVGRLDLDLDLVAYVAHPRMTAAEHVAHLCRLGGSIPRTTADGELEIVKRPAGQPDKALKYGRELTEYRAARSSVPNPARFAIGFGPAGSTSAPDALKQTKTSLPDSAKPGGPGVVREPAAMLRTAGAASNASQALQEAAAATGERLAAECFLLPGLRPGEVFEVQSLPDEFSGGPWLVTRVTHRLDPASGGRTLIDAENADSESLLGQLVGAALSAVGSLL